MRLPASAGRLLSVPAVKARVKRRVLEAVIARVRPGAVRWRRGAPVLAARRPDEPLALYVHFPFCSSACRYCIFARTVRTDRIDAYIEALLTEIDLTARLPALRGRRLSSVYLGGGTPSVVPASRILRVMRRLRTRFDHGPDLWVTLEGNPESLDVGDLPLYREAGINRISCGVQSLDDALLEAMGRRHTGARALGVIAEFQEAGFENLSADLIYGFEGQSCETFLRGAARLAEAGVAHLTAFPLITFESRARRGEEHGALERRQVRMQEGLVHLLEGRGYRRYSTEDFATTPESENRYEIDAWRMPRVAVVGLGAGALSSACGCTWSNLSGLGAYMSALREGRLPVARSMRVSRRDEMRRTLLVGAKYLRVDRALFEERFGVGLRDALEPVLSTLEAIGLVTVDDDGIDVTGEGRFMISRIWSELVLANLGDAARGTRSLGVGGPSVHA
ncbi:MAG: coproporphyrinogen III oxidase family protein [Deltaproteobacteria bacterium]|nr:coproporphyrinogen III oxidase family protein [Deltaproteobacteria bacterium]